MPKPRISVITPTWNRGKYLPRVYKGLLAQTFQDFEWIVANDGSDDDTHALIMDLASKSPFQVVLIQASVHIGKARMDNEAITDARGEFIVWCDSDNYFMPNALDIFISGWESIPQAAREKFVGVVALCKSSGSILNIDILKQRPFDAKIIELECKYYMKEDAALFLRSEILKKHRFPEVDFLVPESAVWSELNQWQIRIFPEVVMQKEYRAQNCVSFGSGMKYNRGRAHAMAISVRYQGDCPSLSVGKHLWRTINYFRYCIHGDIDLKTAFKLWGNNTSRLFSLACIAPASLLALKDRLQKKVIKTHLEFESARRCVKIKTYIT